MRRRRSILGLTIALLGGIPTSSATDPDKAATEWLSSPSEAARIARVEAHVPPVAIEHEDAIDLTLERWMALYRIPGLSVAVFEGHRLLWAKAYGVKEAGRPDPITVEATGPSGAQVFFLSNAVDAVDGALDVACTAGSGSLFGLGTTSVLLVDSATATDLAKGPAQDIVASVVLHARTLGGNEIKSAHWTFPIRVCSGCLVTCPPKADDPLVPGPDCLSTAEDPTPNCRAGLDSPVDCRLCRGNPACSCK